MIWLHFDYNTIWCLYLIPILSGTLASIWDLLVHNPILETQNIHWHIQNSTIIQNISCEHILNEDSILNMCWICNAYANIMQIVCVKDWGCVKDQSKTVVILQAQMSHKKGEMTTFLDSGWLKYGGAVPKGRTRWFGMTVHATNVSVYMQSLNPDLDQSHRSNGRPLGPGNMWMQINISWKGDGPELLGSQWLDLWK